MEFVFLTQEIVAYFTLGFCLTLYLLFGYNFMHTVKKFPEMMSKPFRLFGFQLRISTKTFGIILYIFLLLLILFIAIVLLPSA